MACFLVPTAGAVAAGVASKVAKKNEKQDNKEKSSEQIQAIPVSRKLSWLVKMLLGGAVLLAFEHVWHGEVVPFFPFLTAMEDSASMADMFHEMATVGVTMTGIILVVWIGMLAVVSAMEKKLLKAKAN
ncbi:hypothetical protein [Lachnospira pectinoschiza]|uniref:Uncharacterized protein n=1 Tax=Lachnospira pectinoschiza TaxID=28052 RepID=A0A1G9SPS1_9FIRM|nr:hypothetical protein [Lachnospira pectinoschiza]SDM36825.1 hypothetical protein SAMN05216544_0027 [Lachnospira pectinoschiza]